MSIHSIIRRNIEKIREVHKNQKLVFCSGSFDLTHAGHVLFFEDCKKLGEILAVAVGPDKILRDLKGDGRPVMNEEMRMRIVASLKPVDYCFLDQWSTKENPLAFLPAIFALLKPDMYAVNDDGFKILERRKIAEQFGVPMVVLARTCPPEFEQISTTKLIEKIKKNF